ncbi:MAG: ribonucleoside triphosphate reductase [Planctomycetota bacterium]|jgi:ribonucleoside-triphosphate reductase
MVRKKVNFVSSQFTQIRKRDGRLVPFDTRKITTAILKAGRATGEVGDDGALSLTNRVLSVAQMALGEEKPTVEQIQDLVEQVLLASPFEKTAKAFILYRDQHARNREMTEKASVDRMDGYLNRLDWKVKENSNMGFSLQGLNYYISSENSNIYWLNKIYTADVRQAHNSGALHIHDLGLIAGYCVGWDLYELLSCGFRGVPAKVESKPAKHFSSILGQIVNFFYTLQGEVAGALAFSNFDTLLAPFIRYDGLSYDQVKQALQEFVFNINVPTRVGFQTPFTNITLDLQPLAILANEPVIIGGKPQDQTYGEFQREMNLFNQAFLEVMAEGDAKGRPFSFPIPTYNITPEFDWDKPELKPLWEVTAKYGIPYFANFVNSDMSPDDVRSMCCRIQLDLSLLKKRGGGLFSPAPLTGSIGVVTVNMPRIGYLAADESEFFERLGRLMEIARTSLETKRKVVEQFTEKDLYPYTKYYLRDIKNRHSSYWHNHFSTIGIIGMNEACLNLLGCDIGSPEGRAFAIKALDYVREKLLMFQQETGNLYNLEATPAEGTTYRLSKLDKERFGDIICANELETSNGAAPFYTNSTHLPVNYTDDIFKVLDLQDDLQTRYTGGTVLHIFLGEATPDPQAIKMFIRKVCQNYRLPYFTISPTFSVCPEHGYISGEHCKCEKCNAQTEVYSRVVGYLRPVNRWNEGKQAEFKLRSMYKIEG